ncbi:hypothetical protein AMATHDRAFT_47216 [Amanita thiersii Skay4041]|uniref:Uncharacterized protein n=1 Tax=Amanita thiersii Skay4041 TaxID=703135 RepID=A0A2A9NSQ9_9AGAR|nr:hypothetical protein AMATHDRAFT_47216 [Amanita thiersii Skay4041]
MIPLLPALALSILSFIASAFVILRIIVPILPPHPLSKRVSPAEFGLPKFRFLSIANKSHVWLASLDILTLIIFVWEAVTEATGGATNLASAADPGSSIRLWIIMTLRQTCLLVLFFVALLHVRLGRPVSFGKKHWMLWAPTMLLFVTSTAFAGVLSAAGIGSLFIGLTAYSSAIAVLSTITLGCLFWTLYNIKRNLAAIEEEADPWPPLKQIEEKPRPSFATEEIDAIKDGASWITSNASSRRNSMSAWSFSTHHTVTADSQRGHSIKGTPGKSSYWFGSSSPGDSVPPVPPLPSQYGPVASQLNQVEGLHDPDPFRRDIPTPRPHFPRERLDSQTSWLTSTNGSHTTISEWSFPNNKDSSIRNISTADLHTPLTSAISPVSRPVTPALADAQVLGGYGYAPGSLQAEKGVTGLSTSSSSADISMSRALSWLLTVWLPFVLGLPYIVILSQRGSPSTIVSVLMVLSVTLSPPILALNVIFSLPAPIPVGLFESGNALPIETVRGPSHGENMPYSFDYKRSMSTSVTVVESRRSGDVWLTNGDAVDGKNKIGRAVGMLSTLPKLSVLPPEEAYFDDLPPVPIRDESSLVITAHNRSQSESSAQFGRVGRESKTSSHLSGGDENLAFAAKVMVAQRHYSALAQTMMLPSPSPDKTETNGLLSATTAVDVKKPSAHLRTRSVTSVSDPEPPSISDSLNISGPPPSVPLPPTPPTVRVARLAQLKHKKSFSSDFSLDAIDDVNEIDILTANVLPFLVPGLKVGNQMKIKEKPVSLTRRQSQKIAQRLNEFGEDFSSPELHSTPRRLRDPRGRKQSGHKKNHYSLPSLGLGKDGVHSLAVWSAEIKEALEFKVGQYTALPSNVEIGRRNTVFGADSIPNYIPVAHLHAMREEEERNNGLTVPLRRSTSARSPGLRADVPICHNENRLSALTVNTMVPPSSAASTITLLEDFEAGLDSGPLAESTPHNTVTQKPKSKYAPPTLPLDTEYAASSRRSSIIYIKSDDDHIPRPEMSAIVVPETVTTNNPSTISSIAQWSSRAVRPLILKGSKLQRNGSGVKPIPSSKKALRPLALLQDRDSNAVTGEPAADCADGPIMCTQPKLQTTRPLTLGKRQKARAVMSEKPQDENTPPFKESSLGSSTKSKGLKPLKLARSDTAKMRGILRKNEVIPDVIVRPPSTSEHTSFAYTFHD